MTKKRENDLTHELAMMAIDLKYAKKSVKFEKRWQLWFSLMTLALGFFMGCMAGNSLTNMDLGPMIEDYQQAVCDLKFSEGLEPVVIDKDPRNIECEAHPDEVDDTSIHVRRGW